MQPLEYKSLFDVLDEIERRPSMFLGGDERARATQLNNLELLLVGYELALDVHHITEPGSNFLRGFTEFVQQSLGLDTTCGPIAAIRFAASDDEQAWETLWDVARRYRRMQSKTARDSQSSR